MTVRDHGDPGDGRSTPPPLQPPVGVVTVRAGEQRGAVEILRDADLAMYAAKTTGQATSHFQEAFTQLNAEQPSPTAQNSGH